jgi:hypothetical protein
MELRILLPQPLIAGITGKHNDNGLEILNLSLFMLLTPTPYIYQLIHNLQESLQIPNPP